MAELFPKTILFVCLVALASSTSQTTTVTSRGTTVTSRGTTVTSRGTTVTSRGSTDPDAFMTSRDAMDTDATENIISTQRKEFPKDMTAFPLGSPKPVEKDEPTLEDIEALINDNSGLETCNCPDLATTGICNCTALQGKIVNSDVALSNPDLTYNLDVGGETSIVIVYFKKEDLTILTSFCEYTIGGNHYDSDSLLTMKDENMVITDGVTPITALIGLYTYCKYTLYYFAFPLRQTVISLNETKGELTPFQDDPVQTVISLNEPKGGESTTLDDNTNQTVVRMNTTTGDFTSPNDTGEYGYDRNTQILWIIEPKVEEGLIVRQFNLTINMLDLGADSLDIHGSNKVNETRGDFLLIGPGGDVLGGSDIMFFGQNEAVEPQQVVSLGNVAHVFFYSTVSLLNATGFNISYVATVEDNVTTTTASPTPKPPENLENTIVAINGILNDMSKINETIDTFKLIMGNMSAEYVKNKPNCSLMADISSSMVKVYDTRTCNNIFCDACCVAFNFSVAAEYDNGSWVFNEETLVDMVNDEELEKEFITPHEDVDCTSTEGCKVCDEHPPRTLWMYIVVPVAIVVFAVIVSMVVWIVSYKDHAEDARKKYEAELRDRKDDNRRRSSCDVSILGLGGSMASRGSLSSRRFTMPFPKTKKDDDMQDDEDGIDTSDFKEYDPDFGRVDPAEFGLHRELLDDRNLASHYTNAAFVDDDDHEKTLFQRQSQQHTAMAAGTDSDDSDREAVIFSGPSSMKSKKKTAPISLTATVDVHRSDDDSVQMMNVTGETAL